jgi:hypothetical protein
MTGMSMRGLLRATGGPGARASGATGIPYRFVNLRTGAVSGSSHTPLAEVGSNITEFGYLSQQTGDRKYYDASKRALRAVWDRRSGLDLVGTTIDVGTGVWTDSTARVDPPVDSFFEDLHGAHAMFGDSEVSGWYRTLTDAILQRLAEAVDGRLCSAKSTCTPASARWSAGTAGCWPT